MRAILIASCLMTACASAPIAGPDLAGIRIYPKSSIEIGKSSFKAGSGTLNLQIDNRSDDEVKVGAFTVTISDTEGSAFAPIQGSGDGEGEVLGASEGMVVPIAIKWKWPAGEAEMLSVVERKLIKLRVEGSAKIGGQDAAIGAPTSVGTPVLPIITVRHVEATREGDLSSADLGFRFEVRNDNFFSVKISGLSVTLNVEGVEMAADQVLTNGDRVGANQSIILELPVTMDRETHPKTLRQLLRRGNLSYTVKGKVKFHGIEQPVDIASEIQFPEL
jgi:LEA14-like dessication related protein